MINRKRKDPTSQPGPLPDATAQTAGPRWAPPPPQHQQQPQPQQPPQQAATELQRLLLAILSTEALADRTRTRIRTEGDNVSEIEIGANSNIVISITPVDIYITDSSVDPETNAHYDRTQHDLSEAETKLHEEIMRLAYDYTRATPQIELTSKAVEALLNRPPVDPRKG